MDVTELRSLYDAEYAATYEDNYLLSDLYRECTEFELSLISQLLKGGQSWLDVGCGTGYFLSQFTHVERAGIDISPAMLEQARRANPKILLRLGDFCDDVAEWRDRWDLVTSTWYAYAYSGSVFNVERIIRNLAAWTSPGGTCFLPVCDPDVLCKTTIPLHPKADSSDGQLSITGVVWTWVDQPSGRRHTNLIAPNIQHMVEVFREFFDDVEVMKYPRFKTDGLAVRKAIMAKKKRLSLR